MMNNGEMNNKKLYKETFSKLRASDTLKTEAREMEKIRPRVRFTKVAAACMALLMVTGASSGLTYAATGGETANPIQGIRIYLDGYELGTFDYKQNDDGSYTVLLDKGGAKNFNIVDDENGDEFSVQKYDGTNLNGEVTYNPEDGKMTYVDDDFRLEAYGEKEPNDDASYDTYTIETDPSSANEADADSAKDAEKADK